jgi:predicted nucleic acid-binding protein
MLSDGVLPTPMQALPGVLADGWSPRIQALLRGLHEQSSRNPLRSPDDAGAFSPSRVGWAPPVVVDANVLRNDILYACRKNQRTALLTAANSGLLRVFCATHVVDEVEEHAAKWTAGSPVTTATFLDRWRTEYLPLLPVVTVPAGLLDHDETMRIQSLSAVDPDDVPSVTLAILLGAFFLSEDRRALTAAYGTAPDSVERRQWLRVLKAGGDAGMLTVLLDAGLALGAVGGGGLFHLGRWVVTRPPWLLLPLMGVAAIGARRAHGTGRKLLTGARHLLTVTAEAAVVSDAARTRFAQAATPTPSWQQLSQELGNAELLTRACLHALARSTGHRSAVELAAELRPLPVAQSAGRVRRTLRAQPCFQQVYPGRWQVGLRR